MINPKEEWSVDDTKTPVEPDNTLDDAVITELKEKTPYHVFLIPVYRYVNAGKKEYHFDFTLFRNLSLEALALARNFVFALKGYTFENRAISNFFSGFSWYHPNPSGGGRHR